LTLYSVLYKPAIDLSFLTQDWGEKMISGSCDFKEFVEAIMDNDIWDILYLADLEATDAERQFYRGKIAMSDREKCGKQYAETLKCFLNFMRYGVKSTGVSDEEYQLFQAVRQQVQERGAANLND